MYISTKDWKNYIYRLSALDQKAGELMQEWIRKHGFSDTQAMIDYAYAVAQKYGEGSAALAAEMYDAVAEMAGKMYPPAVAARAPGYSEVAKTVNGILKHSVNPNSMANGVSRLVKRTGADTTLMNAERDGAEFAWVPNGDTCAFCITLASRGWQRMSKKALKNGHAEHIHANCDCTYSIRFDGKGGVRGYDPQKYRDMYYGAEGNTPKEQINSMRRIHYENNKDLINAQKRAAYALRATGGRILDPYGDYENKWAENYYEEIRHKSTDCRKISEKLGVPREEIEAIKNYLFYDKSWYNDLTGEYERFAPDPAIAQSWQRLAEGKPLPHDITLINHERYEMRLKKETPGISHSDAHSQATMKYNYQDEADIYYATLRESKKNRQ